MLSRGPSLRTTALVGAGGAVGTVLRYGVGTLGDSGAGATLAVNLLGAFALGCLLGLARTRDAAQHTGRELPRIHAGQTFLGTGMLGGFTTYSALALEVVTLPGWQGAAYGALTVVAGVGAALAGIVIGRRAGS